MNVIDILKSYAERPTDTTQDFDEVARAVPASTLGEGLADAFKSDRTADFASLAASLFGGSSPQQRAGLVGQLIRSVAPAVLSTIAGGMLGKVARASTPTQGDADIAPEQASQLSEAEVRELAAAAQNQDPSVLDRVGSYYAQHPEVVKVLGGAALAVALGQIAQRMKR